MIMDLNLLYCFDENYNEQAYVSINSILKHSNINLSIYIVHKDPKSFEMYEKMLRKNENIKSINLYKFKIPNLKFPNLNNKHVSLATYYRMFIEDYIPSHINFLLYIDPDVICLNDPKNEISKVLNELNKSKNIISAREVGNENSSAEIYKRLNLKGSGYFNAGVIFINYKEWSKKNIKDKLIDLMRSNYENIIFWDQDVLNLYFDGDFNRIDKDLNYNFIKKFDDKSYIDSISKSILFLHYSGKTKPWSFEGVNLYSSRHYLELYRNLFNVTYHIERKKNKIQFILAVFESIYKLKFLKAEFPLKYLGTLIKKIFV